MLHEQLGALALTAIAIAASGCGGSTKSPSQTSSAAQTTPTSSTQTEPDTPTSPLTKAKLIASANAICEQLNSKRASTKINTLPQLAASEQTASTELGKLVPPASMAKDWSKIVAASQAVSGNILKLGQYAELNKTAPQSLLTAVAEAQTKMQIVAKRGGFKDCARTS